jgi:hypothetical protein
MPSSMRVSVKVLLRGFKFKFTDANSKAKISKLFDKILSEPLSDLNATIRTWEGNAGGENVGAIPSFEIVTSDRRNTYLKKIVLSGNEIGIEKWKIIDVGTDTRWAIMNPGYKQKTQPGQFKSRKGGGSILIHGRRAMQERGLPPRSIQARGWSKIISERLKQEVNNHTDDILDAVTDLL